MLVKFMDWYTDSVESCCALNTLCRLEGEYISQENSDTLLVEYKKTDTKVYEIANNFKMMELKGCCPTLVAAVPVHLAFAAVLDDMINSRNSNLSRQAWMVNDTYCRNGDVHNGIFSTKRFMEWLGEQNVANITTSHRMGGRRIRVWAFTLRTRPVNRLLKRSVKEYKQFYVDRFKDFEVHKTPIRPVYDMWSN